MAGERVERVERIVISDGMLGTNETVEKMATVAMGEYGTGSMLIRDLVLGIIHDAKIPERNKIAEIKIIHKWVQDRLRYVRDPLGYELLTYPEDLATIRRDGDCDDHSILEAAMLGVVGIPTRFIVYGYNGGPFSHVALEANVNGRWLPLDPIAKDKPIGWVAPYTSRKAYPVNSRRGFPKSVTLSRTLALGLTLGGIYSAYKKILGRFI